MATVHEAKRAAVAYSELLVIFGQIWDTLWTNDLSVVSTPIETPANQRAFRFLQHEVVVAFSLRRTPSDSFRGHASVYEAPLPGSAPAEKTSFTFDRLKNIFTAPNAGGVGINDQDDRWHVSAHILAPFVPKVDATIAPANM